MEEFLLLVCNGFWDMMDVVEGAWLTRDISFRRGFIAEASVRQSGRAFDFGYVCIDGATSISRLPFFCTEPSQVFSGTGVYPGIIIMVCFYENGTGR